MCFVPIDRKLAFFSFQHERNRSIDKVFRHSIGTGFHDDRSAFLGFFEACIHSKSAIDLEEGKVIKGGNQGAIQNAGFRIGKMMVDAIAMMFQLFHIGALSIHVQNEHHSKY